MDDTEEGVIQQAVESGQDLRIFANDIKTKMDVAQKRALLVYVQEAKRFADLHRKVTACDDVLKDMEGLLFTFQSSLKSMSGEIQELQQQSQKFNHQLKNRQSVRGDISQFVDEIMLPEALVNSIRFLPVTEIAFRESLHELNHKIKFVKEQEYREAAACEDVRPLIENLKLVAISKIRDFLMEDILAMRKPLANYEIPRGSLIEHRFFQQFLMENDRSIALEIKTEYIETMSKVYYSYFKEYHTKLLKLLFEDQPIKDDLVGAEAVQKTTIFTPAKSIKTRANVFSLGNRGECITESGISAPPIVPHATDKMKNRYHHETLFRSIFFALVDNCLSEYLFLGDFFLDKGNALSELFNQIFGRTLTFISKTIEKYASESWDTIGLSLSCCVCQLFKQHMLGKRNNSLDYFWEDLYSSLNSRLFYVLELNIASIQEIDVEKYPKLDPRPHHLPRRFAEFTAALVVINETLGSNKLEQLCATLVSHIQKCMIRFSSRFPEKITQLVFMINNYKMMTEIVSKRCLEPSNGSPPGSSTGQTESPSPPANAVVDVFKAQESTLTTEYAVTMLTEHFSNLHSWVNKVRSLIDQSDPASQRQLLVFDKSVPGIVTEFNESWRTGIGRIHHKTQNAFSDLNQGHTLVQQTLTALVELYHEFTSIVSQKPPFNRTRHNLLNLQTLMAEVRKVKPVFDK